MSECPTDQDMKTNRPHSLAIALPLLLGLMLYAPAFFGEQAYSFVLGIDSLAVEGVGWQQPLGAIVQSLLDTLAYLNPTSLRLTGFLALALATALLVAGLGVAGVHPAGAGIAGAMLIAHPASIAAVMKLDNTGLAVAMVLLVLAATRWSQSGLGLRYVLLIAPALAHPIGVCALPLIWLMQDEEGQQGLLKPIILGLFALPLVI